MSAKKSVELLVDGIGDLQFELAHIDILVVAERCYAPQLTPSKTNPKKCITSSEEKLDLNNKIVFSHCLKKIKKMLLHVVKRTRLKQQKSV